MSRTREPENVAPEPTKTKSEYVLVFADYKLTFGKSRKAALQVRDQLVAQGATCRLMLEREI